MFRSLHSRLMLGALFLICGCSKQKEASKPLLIETASQLNAPEYVIGVPVGAAAMAVGEKLFPRAHISYLATHSDAYTAVKAGKIDAYIYDRHALEYAVSKNPDFVLLDEDLGEQNIVIGVPFARAELLPEINNFIGMYRADGTYKSMHARWIKGQSDELPELPVPAQPERTLRIGTSGMNEPMSFYTNNGELTGFDIEFIHRLAYAMNADIKVTAMTFEALVASAEAGKIDLIVASLNDTPERRRCIHMSKTYIDSRITALIKKSRLLAPPSILDTFQGKTVASVSGTVFDLHIDRRIKQVTHQYFNDLPSMVVALETRKVDALGLDEPVGKLLEAQFPHLYLVPEPVCIDAYGFAVLKGNPLTGKASAVIRRLEADGTLKLMEKRWFNASEEGKEIPVLDYRDDFDGSAGVLRFSHDNVNVPMSYVGAGGSSQGFDVELAARIAYELNMVFKPVPLGFGGLLESLMAQKADMVGGAMSITPERLKTVDFTEGYYSGGIYLLARRPELMSGADQFAGKKIGVLTGSVYDQLQKEHFPDAVAEHFTSVPDILLALKIGKLDATIFDEPIAQLCAMRMPGFHVLPELLTQSEYAFILNQKDVALCQKINDQISKMRVDGTMKELNAIWLGLDEALRVVSDIPTSGPNGMLRVVMNSGLEPFSFLKNGKPVGYDIDMITRMAKKLGLGLDIQDMNFGAILPAIISGKADVGLGGITMTPERAQNVLFSDPNYYGGVAVLARDDSTEAGGTAPITKAPWKARFKSSFISTFVVENRYQLVLRGFGVTVLISVLAILLGTVMGFGVCAMRRSTYSALVIPAKMYIRAVQGTPILVLLMIFYYIVFGRVDVNAISVAIFAFAISFSAYAAEMFRSGIDAVDRGQIEAAEALGFRRVGVFFRIVFPQAARHVLPVFKGEVVGTVKMTSVVGYIAIQDLTKVSDIIRSRTYEAFFPLLATALIYFVFTYALTLLLSRVEVRIDPRQRARVLKGVEVKK